MKTTRRTFLSNTTIAAAGFASVTGLGLLSVSGCEAMTHNKLNEQRKNARNRSRRIIMNNDGNDVYTASLIKPMRVENLLEPRSLGLSGSQVDSIFYCTGVPFRYFHQSELTELGRRRNEDDDRILQEYIQFLKLEKTDTLHIISDFAEKQGMEVFWSMRMNDTHDSGLSSVHLISDWKTNHPECLIGKYGDKFPYGGNRWSSLNYNVPAVREMVYQVFYDVCSRYNIDGIELDFFRHPVLFKEQMTGEPVTQDHCDKMTALMQQIRDMTTSLGLKRKRPFLIAVRIPDSVGYCKAMGIDLIRWMEDDLVDIVTGSDYFKLEPWENLASLGKKYEVPVYACFEGRRIEQTYAHPPDADEALPIWRGEALNAWKAGVNGIYTFNRFNPLDRVFREIGNPELLKILESIDQTVYVNPVSWSRPEVWLRDGDSYVSKEIKVY